MRKSEQPEQLASGDEQPPGSRALSPAVRCLLSLLIAAHLLAVFIAPMNVAVPQQLPLEREKWPVVPWLAEGMRPYLDLAYLNHGYGFFAPDPGPSFLIRYTAELADGSTVEESFPDLARQWPRLRYHRHFMLTSQLDSFPSQPDTVPPKSKVLESYARHLLKVHDARRVTLEHVRHSLATLDEVLEGTPLDAPYKYESRPLIEMTAEEAAAWGRGEAP